MRQTHKKRTAPQSHPYRKRLARRAFFSLLLILGALYIREKEPAVTDWARTQLHVSMDFSTAEQFLRKTLPFYP